MRLYTIEVNDKAYVAVENKNKKLVTLDFLGIHVNDMNELIVRYDELCDAIRKALAVNENAGMEAGEYRIKAPVPVPIQDMVCLGVNYHDHIKETVDVLDFTKKKDAVYFSKRVNRANDPDGIIPAYDFVDSLDYEAELGVILKKDAFNISIEEAATHILGYTIINDVSARNLQFKHQQWYRGKSLDGYTPMGPCIVTADEIGDAHDLAISCYVNDEKRQESNTKYMITTVEEAVSELSQGMTLKAGTVIATGTPGGVGMGMKPPVFLKEKDVVRCEIEGIGSLSNTVG
ncbi:MAG: fumarylacetoacetate hydrolase family protein [Lachnospiraceae bacterium]|nr:fumarylacetoacetate hydrolase family protein [Lachnospiraceae bacterium]